MHIFYSTLYVHNKNDKIIGGRIFPEVWLGFGSYTEILLYWYRIRVTYSLFHHGSYDYYEFQVTNYPRQIILDIFSCTQNKQLETPGINYYEINSPFSPEISFSYKVTLPTSSPIGETWKNYRDFCLPLIVRISN